MVARPVGQRAAREPDVRTVRASIRPDQASSVALVAQHGFRRVGEQWDEEYGLETVLEVEAGTAPAEPPATAVTSPPTAPCGRYRRGSPRRTDVPATATDTPGEP